jgi:DNA primase
VIPKDHIDLARVVESAGVELRRQGSRHVALCPFHDENTPSFFVFGDRRFKCFGCGESGDVIDFVQKQFGLSFQDALKHLGIEQGRITPEMQRHIEQQKRKAELIKKFRKWENRYANYVGDLIFKTEKLMMNGIPPEDLDLYASLLHELPVLEYHLDIIINGSDKKKFQLYKEARKNGKF